MPTKVKNYRPYGANRASNGTHGASYGTNWGSNGAHGASNGTNGPSNRANGAANAPYVREYNAPVLSSSAVLRTCSDATSGNGATASGRVNVAQWSTFVAAMLVACSVAPIARAQTAEGVVVPGSACPWLAGMPDGTPNGSGDFAPTHSPVLVPLAVPAGSVVRILSASGQTSFGSAVMAPPDGTPFTFCHQAGAVNGIGDACWDRAAALVGVFLGDDAPNLTPAPAGSSFNTEPEREASVIVPQLKQVFYIGDGQTSAGALQSFVVPPLATRLYLGISDGFGWSNNSGSFVVSVAVGAVPCDSIDFNANGVFPEDQDVIDFFDVLAGGECPACNDIDFNNNGVFPEDQDVIDFFNVLAGGTCP